RAFAFEWDVSGPHLFSGDLFEQRDELVDRYLCGGVPDVEDLIPPAILEGRGEGPVDGVVDITERPLLLAVALHRELLVQLEPAYELRDDVIPAHRGAVDIVVAKDREVVVADAREIRDHELPGELAPAVRPPRVQRIG